MTTIDFTTGIERPSDPKDYITKITSCHAVPPGTPHPLWSAFLDRIFHNNTDLIEFMQRFIGYCCTGVVSEHMFIFAYGTGANGKSTFINTIVQIFGNYATIADMNTFLTTEHERHPTDLAKLRGAQLVVAFETQKGRRWDEAKIKALTGGDKITARFMRQDFFEFIPTHKLFIVGNHKPRLSTVDEAMRRRLLLVPFTVEIPEKERDIDLPKKLEAEHPAILRWIIEGCKKWLLDGLKVPAVVRLATETYFTDQDSYGQWLEECVEVNVRPGILTETRDLFLSWKQWAEQRKLSIGNEMSMIENLDARGLERTKHPTNRRSVYRVALRTPVQTDKRES